jgi:hypothetical protein
MGRLSTQIIWATAGSVVAGIGLVSLLNGVGPPWLVIAFILAAAGAITLARWYRRRPADPRYTAYPELDEADDATGRRRGRERPAPETGPPVVGSLRADDEASVRRAGIRAQSLGAPAQSNPPDEQTPG